MLNITLSLQQTAEVVTDLSRGKTVAQVAARKHLPVEAVEGTAAAYGPGRADLAAASRRLNKQLRDQRPVEDLDVDVPAPRRALEEAPIETDPVDVRIWSCVACGFDLMAPEGTSIADAEQQISDHIERAHPSRVVPEVELVEAYVHEDHAAAYDPDNCEACAHEPVPLPASTAAHNHDDNGVRYPTCPACRAEAEVPLVIEGEVEPEPVNLHYYCGDCGWGVVAPLDDQVGFEADIQEHEEGHRAQEQAIERGELVDALREVAEQLSVSKLDNQFGTIEIEGAVHTHPNPSVYYGGCSACREEMGFPQHTNGHTLEEPAALPADAVVPTNGHDVQEIVNRLLAQFDLDSARSPLAEAEPTSGPQQPVVGVEEPPAAPAPDPVLSDGWLASGPRTVERLLDEAERTGHRMLVGGASYIRGLVQDLADELDRYVATEDQRRAIMHELDILGRRQDELTEKLSRLDEGGVAQRVVVQTPHDWAEAVTDPAVAVEVRELYKPGVAATADGARYRPPRPSMPEVEDADEQSLSRVEKLRALPFNRMSVEARARCKAWATEYGLQVTAKGMQPKATVAAYLAAHPEDDPRQEARS